MHNAMADKSADKCRKRIGDCQKYQGDRNRVYLVKMWRQDREYRNVEVNWVIQNFKKSLWGSGLSVAEAKILEKNWIIAKSLFHFVPSSYGVINRD